MKKSQLDHVARAFAVLGAAFPLWLVVTFYRLGDTSFLGFAFIGLSLLHATLHPRWIEMAWTFAIAACYFAIYRAMGGTLPEDPVLRAAGILAFGGAGSLVVMVVRLLWSGPDEQKARARLLGAGLTPIVFLVYTPVAFRLLHVAAPSSFDHFLYAFDGRFGVQAGFEAGRLFAQSAGLKALCSVVYLGLPLAMSAAYLAGDGGESGFIRTFLAAGVIGVALFQIVPAAGPVYAFAGYPDSMPAIGPDFLRPIHLDGAKLNAIPSLHAAWALLIFWRASRAGRMAMAAGGIFLGLTLLATLGLGEHYLIDLVVAAPFAAAIHAVFTAGRDRNRAWKFTVLVNAALVAGWLAALRAGILVHIPVAAAWGLASATLAWAFWSKAKLHAPAGFGRAAQVPLGKTATLPAQPAY